MHSSSAISRLGRLHSGTAWAILAILAFLALVVVPVLYWFVPPDSPFHMPGWMVTLAGRFLALAMVALALDLIWGYTGILSLGHGVFFAMGGYVMGAHLTRVSYEDRLPNFLQWLDYSDWPWYWAGFDSFLFTLLMIALVPGVLAFVFGVLAFRSRVRGVYFAIITQALTFGGMHLFFRTETGFGGDTGLTNFTYLLGLDLGTPQARLVLFWASALALILAYLLCRWIVTSKLGRVLTAVRDAENRVRFTGYDPLRYKLFVWVVSAVLCGVAGALYVPQTGVINPSEMVPSASIEMAIWVALGGRGTLVGAILGAGVVNVVKTWATSAHPDLWLFILGGIFIFVTLLMPRGVIGLFSRRKEGKA
ncbi:MULTISPECIES: urea ABC transporter permease subunit UrtC [unclassified Thioalkalivibrio]|uniref:urea ABC transporter permease subunit UrtC n=1 Tax=unclassified Thioalkalivibrio TaxID=2621013 RepID=UPI0003600411|nr:MULTISPECIES: urea ABC transporter permease subunit UrtC [unclassified Thioalkalivibrio]